MACLSCGGTIEGIRCMGCGAKVLKGRFTYEEGGYMARPKGKTSKLEDYFYCDTCELYIAKTNAPERILSDEPFCPNCEGDLTEAKRGKKEGDNE